MLSKLMDIKPVTNDSAEIERLGEIISQSENVIIGAGAGLSASAGFTYAGKRFE